MLISRANVPGNLLATVSSSLIAALTSGRIYLVRTSKVSLSVMTKSPNFLQRHSFVILVCAVPAIIGFLIYTWVPSVIDGKIAGHIQGINDKLGAVKSTVDSFDTRMRNVETSTNKSTEQVGDINLQLAEIRGLLRGYRISLIKSPADVEGALKRAVSARGDEAKYTLPVADQVLNTAQEKRIPL